MLRRLVALTALSAAVLVAPATGAGAEPYSPRIPTETIIEVTVRGPGEPIVLRVSATANYPTPPEGDIAVQVLAGGGAARGARSAAAAPIFETTVHFVDEPIAIDGPALPRGRYLAAAQLSPDNADLFLPSDDLTAFRVGDEVGGVSDPGDDNGGLPNTGGPNLVWLLLGTGMVAAGAGSVVYSRRRQPTLA